MYIVSKKNRQILRGAMSDFCKEGFVRVIFLAQDPPPMTVEEKRQAAKLEAGCQWIHLSLKLGPFLSKKLSFPTGTRFCVCGLLSYRLPDLSCDFSVSSRMCVCVCIVYIYIHTLHDITLHYITLHYITLHNIHTYIHYMDIPCT